MEHIENINTLPHPSLVRDLFRQYYKSHTESAATSSHWKRFSKDFQVDIRDDGKVFALRGFGFGEYQSRHMVTKALEWTSVLSYLMVLEGRFQILRQLGVAKKLKLPLTYDTFRQSATVDILIEHLEKNIGETPTICIIGDGYGVLSSLLKTRFPKARLLLIDLGQVLLFQNIFLQSRFPNATYRLSGETSPANGLSPDTDFTFIPAEKVKEISFAPHSFDLVVNVASMQEMTVKWVEFYFNLIRKILKPEGFFYCCNRESKTLAGGEVIEFEKFPWNAKDEILFDEEPAFYKWFFSPRPTKNRLKVFHVPVPLGRMFDGKMRHRLVKMAKA